MGQWEPTLPNDAAVRPVLPRAGDGGTTNSPPRSGGGGGVTVSGGGNAPQVSVAFLYTVSSLIHCKVLVASQDSMSSLSTASTVKRRKLREPESTQGEVTSRPIGPPLREFDACVLR